MESLGKLIGKDLFHDGFRRHDKRFETYGKARVFAAPGNYG